MMKNDSKTSMNVGVTNDSGLGSGAGFEIKNGPGFRAETKSGSVDWIEAAVGYAKNMNSQNSTARCTYDSICETITNADDLSTYERIDALKDNQRFYDQNILVKLHNLGVTVLSCFGMFKLEEPKFAELFKLLMF